MRRYGQHFLREEFYATRIVELLDPTPGELVVEIGPGKGALTKILLAKGCKVLAFEIDPQLSQKLKNLIVSPQLQVIQCDFLLVEENQLDDAKLCIGSIPYQSSLEILSKICQLRFERVALIVQKEFAQKLSAKPGERRYTFISALVQSLYCVQIAFDIPPRAFLPAPQVTSSAVVMRRIRQMQNLNDYISFLRKLFSSPNKLLKNVVETMPRLNESLVYRRVRQLSVDEILYLYGKWLDGKVRSIGDGT